VAAELMEAEADPRVGEAVAAEGAGIDIADAVMGALGEAEWPVGEAVKDEAGSVELASEVMGALGESRWPVGEAVRHEAGTVDVSAEVLRALDMQAWPVGEAVRHHAGTVDVADAVMAIVVPVTLAEHPRTPILSEPARPAAANRGWVLVATMAAMFMGVLGLSGLAGTLAVLSGGQATDNMQIAGHDGVEMLLAAPDLVFASAAEVVVEDLSFGDGVMVFQDEGAEGALILWVDEELL
jgi:hypothetical protein